MATKGSIVDGAYSRLRISGLTDSATPAEVSLALDVLEDMMASFEAVNIVLGYRFSGSPDTAEESGIDYTQIGPVKNLLACELAVHFGKELTQTLALMQSAAMGSLYAFTAKTRQVQPSRRMPRGSGNMRLNSFNNFMQPAAQPPISYQTNNITIGGIDDFTESFVIWLSGETIASYAITSTIGLQVSNDSEIDGVISYRVECLESAANLETVSFVVTTDTGRVNNVMVSFNCTE